MTHRILLGIGVALALAVPRPSRSTEGPPPAPREFRAAWVATVGNIDWPSRSGLPADEQRREAVAILDRLVALNLNAAILQVRTAADALYESKLELWSAVLTGRQGETPGYDPLAFWVDEAHRRGLQLHAWFNPFRARAAGVTAEMAASHVSKTPPDWVKPYGNLLWMDPGEPDARAHTLAVFDDVVRRYDVDGIHIDDYFYPYPVKGPDGAADLPFPDDPSWRAYHDRGGPLPRDDWRRQNINLLIEQMDKRAHAIKPQIQVGISPFGLPRPGTVPGMKGFDQYASLYADAETWLRRGWCDYFTPQLYWKIDAPGQPFRPLLDYWLSINERGRHVWPGLSSSRVGEGPRGYPPSEILGQIDIIHGSKAADGEVFFSMKSLVRNRAGLVDQLKAGPYRTPALVPTSPWLDREPPPRPHLRLRDDGTAVVPHPGREVPFLWAAWTRRGDEWRFATHPVGGPIPLGPGVAEVVVSAVDRLGNESERASLATARPR